MRQIKIVVEKHTDGYVAYPLGIKGVVVGEGDTCEEALKDVRSALAWREHRSAARNSPGRLAGPHKTRCDGGAAGVLLQIVLSARGEMI